MKVLFAPGRLEAMTIPTLIVAASHDRLVGISATREAARRLPNSQLICFDKEARHEILREEDAVRNRAMAAIDEFLDRTVPAA